MRIRAAFVAAGLAPLMALGCSNEKAAQGNTTAQSSAAQTTFDPCALLTGTEIQSTLGWAPDSSVKKAYGTTGNCNYFGPKALQQVTLLVGQGMPDMSDSHKMADWRAKQYENYKVTNAVVEPVDDLGVPAIRNEFGIVTIEMAVGSQLVSVNSLSASYDKVHALAGFVLAHMQKK